MQVWYREVPKVNSLYNNKTNFIFTAGALLCLSFLTFSFIPLVSAITWNIDVSFATSNNTIYWDGHSFDYLNLTFYNKSEIDILINNVSVNLSGYVPYTGAIDNLDLGSNNIYAANINITENINVDGNVTANYFFGDGSGLTNVTGVPDNDLHLYFNGSMFINITYNLSAGDVDNVEVLVQPGKKIIFGGILV